MTKQFCEDVLKFLKSEYNDGYEFNIELKQDLWSSTVELKIKSGGFTNTIISSYMSYFFELYRQKEFIEERSQFKWQKELIDLIEGS